MNNSKNIEKETFEKLLGTVEELRESTRKTQQKRDLKTWSDIPIPLTIKAALTRLSKDELSEIRKQLEIKGASQLKKGELIELLSRQIPLSLKNMCLHMDQERYSIISKAIQNKGQIPAPTLDGHQFVYFRNMGILFPGTHEGKRVLVMPEEVLQNPIFQENNKQLTSYIHRNTEWIKLTHGFLYYYGTLSIEELLDLLKKYMKEPVDRVEYLSLMNYAITYYKQMNWDKSGLSYIRVFDPERVKREHKMRKDVQFFPFSKEQLLRAGEPHFVERNESYIHFVNFLTANYDISREEADGIVEECVYATNIGEEPGKIFEFLQSRLEFESIETVKGCMDKVIDLMNNTKQWFLKGYAPKELSALERKSLQPSPGRKDNIIDITTKKKVGRNDPCPCGSGKKFKKCCGR
ncbi:SEC-C metal-binding domain-containing protein [Neobacillus dielmonensis]|uniref:SEC-C metal-binding domain-containing protein n=1 Tax=Neobacillus dielmonensis TaxID=1347369 RepID=UPI0005A97D16|nr:SEC-C metal-binding domain-containing protein [Neobacillus dielmonensis]